MKFDIDDLLGLFIVALVIIFLIPGCVSCPGDDLRIVNPVTWHELGVTELHERCMDWDPKVRGCVISGPDGDMIYTLSVVR